MLFFFLQGHDHILSRTEYTDIADWSYLSCSRIINLCLTVYNLPGKVVFRLSISLTTELFGI